MKSPRERAMRIWPHCEVVRWSRIGTEQHSGRVTTPSTANRRFTRRKSGQGRPPTTTPSLGDYYTVPAMWANFPQPEDRRSVGDDGAEQLVIGEEGRGGSPVTSDRADT